MTQEQQIQMLKRIDAKLTNLLNKPPKETWVNVGVIKHLTGWEGSQTLRTMREGGAVTYNAKTEKYLLESISPIFLKQEYKKA